MNAIITTESGSVYCLNGRRITGGSVPRGEVGKYQNSYEFQGLQSVDWPTVGACMFIKLDNGRTVKTSPVQHMEIL